jgi:hypothetical protein
MNRLRRRISEVEKSMGNKVELVPRKIFKEALKDDSSISGHFESDKQYEVVWPDLSKPDFRTAGEISTPELYGYMLSITKN